MQLYEMPLTVASVKGKIVNNTALYSHFSAKQNAKWAE